MHIEKIKWCRECPHTPLIKRGTWSVSLRQNLKEQNRRGETCLSFLEKILLQKIA